MHGSDDGRRGSGARKSHIAAAVAAATAAATSAKANGAHTDQTPHQRDRFRKRCAQISVLALLTLQNCSLMVVTSYSRSLPGPQYLASTAVVAGELLKTAIILSVLLYEHGCRGVCSVLRVEIFGKRRQTMRFAVPALFYTIQNNFWYYGMSNLDSVTAAVTNQLKVPSTALFSVWLLKKDLNCFRWTAIGMLVFGLIIMQLHSDEVPQKSAAGHHHDHVAGGRHEYAAPNLGASTEKHHYQGMLAMVAACASSGFAGVYLERLFKELDISIWISNLQLQIFCMPVALLAVMSDWHELGHVADEADIVGGLMRGWNSLTCGVVLLNALGGFMVTLTMKYADNILKTFAVSMSLVMNCVLSWLFLGTPLSKQEVLGVTVVITGTWLYNCGGGTAASEMCSSCARGGSVGPPSPAGQRRAGFMRLGVGKDGEVPSALDEEEGVACEDMEAVESLMVFDRQSSDRGSEPSCGQRSVPASPGPQSLQQRSVPPSPVPQSLQPRPVPPSPVLQGLGQRPVPPSPAPACLGASQNVHMLYPAPPFDGDELSFANTPFD